MFHQFNIFLYKYRNLCSSILHKRRNGILHSRLYSNYLTTNYWQPEYEQK